LLAGVCVLGFAPYREVDECAVHCVPPASVWVSDCVCLSVSGGVYGPLPSPHLRRGDGRGFPPSIGC